MEEAKDESAFTKICIAFNCRTTLNSIEGKLPHDLSTEVDGEDVSPAVDPTVVFLGQDNTVLPSDMLSDASWVQRVIDLFDLKEFYITTEVS